jgi:DNA-binding PadR family transcriptional regulator
VINTPDSCGSIYRADTLAFVIEMAILGVLKEYEAHGYELKKRIAELAGGSGGVSFGSLYPALNRLELAGAVRPVDHIRPRLVLPMTGAISSELAALRHPRKSATSGLKRGRRDKKRNRKVYGITDRGETRLRELLVNADPSDDRVFHVQVAFCRFLEPVARLGLFERRRAHLTTELAKRSRPSDTPTNDPYLRSLKERDITTLTDDLGWLDELTRITQEQLGHAVSQPVVTATGGTQP